MNPSAARIIDANANRAREALRVMEDVARFALDDAALTEPIKHLRHDLAAALDAIPGSRHFILQRDTPGDIGTSISTESEGRRTDLHAVASASAKRLTEALRSIEESSKTIDPRVSTSFESLRYRAYDYERTLILALQPEQHEISGICVLITESMCTHHEWTYVARVAIEAGATMLQLREKTLSDSELIARARILIRIARERDVLVIINDRPDIATLTGADGVHLGQEDMSVAEARSIIGESAIIGVSTSCAEEAERAREHGASYCGVGPMFPTTTKRKPVISGPAYLREYLALDPPLPAHVAIGGITIDNVQELVDAGARSVAVSSAVCTSSDPRAACAQLVSILRQSDTPSIAAQ